jgi:hypothetical protein
MSAKAHTLPAVPTRDALVRRAKALSWLSIGWMAIEAGVATVAAVVAGSVALLGFGLDSLIEMQPRWPDLHRPRVIASWVSY